MNLSQTDIDNCKDDELKQVLNRFFEYKDYCDLLSGNSETLLKTEQIIGDIPVQLKEWLTIFNGGLLFDNRLFSTQESFNGVGQLFTFEDINSPEFKAENNISANIICFAMTSYGNYYCYFKGQNDNCVYEWDAEERTTVIKWDSFSEWLNEIIDFAITLIEDGLLDPIID